MDSKVLIHGGCERKGIFFCSKIQNDFYLFDPAQNKWQTIAGPNWNMKPRLNQGYVWTGQHFVIWGGRSKSNLVENDGAVYNYQNKTWTLISDQLPEGEKSRFAHKMIWDGKQILVFGGGHKLQEFAESTLSLYWSPKRPEYTAWKKVPSNLTPLGRRWHSQHWLDGELIIWGGFGADQTYLPFGSRLTIPEVNE